MQLSPSNNLSGQIETTHENMQMDVVMNDSQLLLYKKGNL